MAVRGKVLVIDDDPDFLEFVRIVLESGSYEVYTADSTSEGLSALRELKPDIVLLDVMMSHALDGFNVTKEIRSDPELRDIPLIMISAIVNPEEELFPIDKGSHVDAFMSKPVEPTELLEQVGKLIARQDKK